MMMGMAELLILLLIVVGGAAVFVVGLVAVIWVVAVRGKPSGNEAVRVAAERYARGEIDRDQYEQIKRDLGA